MLVVVVKLATNYEKISRRGTAIILLSKHISCIAIDKLLICMELPISHLNFGDTYALHAVDCQIISSHSSDVSV
jgi:hypothetical protein